MGTRLVEAWERCWWRGGNEAGGGLGTRLVETGLASLPGDLPMSKQVQQASIFNCMPSLRPATLTSLDDLCISSSSEDAKCSWAWRLLFTL